MNLTFPVDELTTMEQLVSYIVKPEAAQYSGTPYTDTMTIMSFSSIRCADRTMFEYGGREIDHGAIATVLTYEGSILARAEILLDSRSTLFGGSYELVHMCNDLFVIGERMSVI